LSGASASQHRERPGPRAARAPTRWRFFCSQGRPPSLPVVYSDHSHDEQIEGGKRRGMILGLPLIGTRSSRKSRYRQANKQLRLRRLRPSQQSRDRSGPGRNLHPISQSLKELSTRGNEQMIERARKRLSKRAKRGFRGYPIATVALYGPDDRAATKLTVGIVRRNMPRPQILGAGSPKGPISAMMPLWHKKCSRSSRRPELGPS